MSDVWAIFELPPPRTPQSWLALYSAKPENARVAYASTHKLTFGMVQAQQIARDLSVKYTADEALNYIATGTFWVCNSPTRDDWSVEITDEGMLIVLRAEVAQALNNNCALGG
jgi:hypothetical protein